MAAFHEKVVNESLGRPDATATQTISLTSTSASATLQADTCYRVVADVDCYVNFEDSVTAATSSHMRLMAGVPEIFKTTATHIYVSAIRVDTDGTLWLTPMDPSRL